ncbi:fimbrial biogenesis chaperone [Pontixanthobacter aquaemixtae]|uniref:Fimbria/pilus periplasmic chaperone n=1 Tax=Pontixanthobacter aquaemixtae TaxID=1958940 RepID=A0A844ZU48_9SPHN|nr:fimbria/pilus periplasmic chaperone [Pontixanthobacter aquaemixtae]MXO91405.1 fimbria/pilus periplasmic chaperone [Pontixanthobacter aquaemixtae]
MKLCAGVMLPLAALLSSGVAGAQEDTSTPTVSDDVLSRGANVSLAPLRIEMDGEQRAETLRVYNPSPRAIGVQVRAFGWKQESGADVYFPSNDVMISPSIITIAPGDTQIFRVVRRDLPAAGERRYRVAVDQLPDPELLRGGEAQARIRFTIPMFIDRETAQPAQIAWSIGSDGLTATNSGQQTARMVNLSLTDAAGQPVTAETGGLHYIHGGSSRSWTIPGGCPTGPVTVSASIDNQVVNVQATNTCG